MGDPYLPAKPLLAATITDIEAIKYPVMASPKLDGIRCLIGSDGPVSRTYKPIPNRYIQQVLSRPELRGLDGELMLAGVHASFRDVTSAVMSEDGEPDFMFWVFDSYAKCCRDQPYIDRLMTAQQTVEEAKAAHVGNLPHERVESPTQLAELEAAYVKGGCEGLMVRSLNGAYKAGRSTVRDGILGKIKRFHDAEAVCIGVVEQLHNMNAARVDALGHTERSSHKAGKVPAGTLGALKVRTPDGRVFNIGTGFSDTARKALWHEQPIGKLVKYKAMDFSDYGLPRHPVFLGFRDAIDV